MVGFTTPILSADQASGAARKSVGTSNGPLTAGSASISSSPSPTTVGANGKLSAKFIDTKTSQETLSKNFNQFLTLLTTQMKNQDPLKPMDTAQFTSQLVQYSQVEQQINTNSTLNSILSQLQSNQALQAAGFLGDTAEVKANGFNHNRGETTTIGYSFPRAASNAIINIYDSRGALVQTIDAPGTDSRTTVNWDGKTSQGTMAPTGEYRFTVTGSDSTGASMDSNATSIVGSVSDVQIVKGEAMVKINGQWFAIGDIISLRPPVVKPVAAGPTTPTTPVAAGV
ncbi:MAG: flagellar hook capping FlgD N-terminal domain-containing protein [Candidatus Pacebacteria bacterium]|nr:flagellar hook capping FlgD N-terminal domain-containing protein [Candidatus Paceibacterota bacterium]